MSSFKSAAAALRGCSRQVCEHLLPGGTVAGNEYRALSRQRGGPGDSFSVNLKSGAWGHFAAGEGGGDLIALWAYVRKQSQWDAKSEAEQWLGMGAAAPAVHRLAWPYLREADPEHPDGVIAARIQTARKFAAESQPVGGTPAELYLTHRGVGAVEDSTVRWRPNAWRSGGALLVIATDGAGEVAAVQQVFLTADGGKAQIPVQKRTNGELAGAAVRLPGAGPVVLCEGPETGLSLWQATGRAVWICLGSIGKAPVEEGAEYIIARDADDAGSPADKALTKAVAAFQGLGCEILIATPPSYADLKKSDWNDVLLREGVEAVAGKIAAAEKTPEVEALPDAAAPARRPALIPGVAPHFRADELGGVEVACLVEEQVGGWMEAAIDFARIERDVGRAQEAAVAAALLEHPEIDPAINLGMDLQDRGDPSVRAYLKLRSRVRAASRREALEQAKLRFFAAPRLQLAAGPGSGKTAAAVRHLPRAMSAGLVVWYLTLTSALTDEIAERLRAGGLPARTIRGRTAKGADGEGMCAKPRSAKRAGELGLNVRAALCASGDAKCRHIASCAYWRQIGSIARPAIFVMPCEYLTTPPPDGVPAPDLIVVDEGALRALKRHARLDPEELLRVQPPTLRSPADAADFLATCSAVHAALLDEAPLKQGLAARSVDREMLLRAAGDAADAARANVADVSPAMNEADSLRALEGVAPSPFKTIARLFLRLAAELRLSRDVVHGVELRPTPWKSEETGERELKATIHIHERRRLLIDPKVPALILDADADHEIGASIWGHHLRHVSVGVKRNAIIRQVCDLSFSKRSLLAEDGVRLEEAKRLIRAVCKIHARVLVITNRPVRCALTGESPSGPLPSGVEWEGATIANFGNIRGVDRWKDFGAVVILGREQPSPAAAEELARALWCDHRDSLALGGAWTRRARGYRLRSGDHAGVMADVHPDERVQVLHELIRERELGQAIDRLRLVHRDEPAWVYLLTSVPLDVSLDQALPFKGLLVDVEAAAVAKLRGALPLAPDWLLENEPSLFAEGRTDTMPTIHGVRRGVSRHREIMCTGSYSTSIWASAYYWPVIYRAKDARGKAQRALLFSEDGCPDQNHLELALGKPVQSMSLDFSWALRWRVEWENTENTEETGDIYERKIAA